MREILKNYSNILDLSDLRNIFLKSCFFNRPLPGMLVLYMTCLIKVVKITHWECDVQPSPSCTTAVPHGVPLQFQLSSPSGVFWASCAAHEARTERQCSDSAWGRTQRTHQTSCQLQHRCSVWPPSLHLLRPLGFVRCKKWLILIFIFTFRNIMLRMLSKVSA